MAWLPLGFLVGAHSLQAVEFREAEYENRPHFVIRTGSATWYYDRAGGGFSRLLDPDGRDWIGFRKEPLSQYPESAAAGYRGLPNLVFRGPDKGAGHPGFDRCASEWDGLNTIRTVTASGRWEWSWTFTEETARFRMIRSAPEQAWWFLYEGTIAGRFSPSTHFWGTNQGGPLASVYGSKDPHFDQWRWIYFGDPVSNRVLCLIQLRDDALPDTLWYLGSSQGGAAAAPDGMVVFGFGRGPKATPLLHGNDPGFLVGFLEGSVRNESDHENLAQRIESLRP